MIRLLEAAAEVFAEEGVQAASVQAIAERAGASIGSLYHFFPNKQALVLAVAERCMQECLRENAAATSADMLALPVEQVLGKVFEGQVALQRRMPVWAVMTEALATIPEARPLHLRMSRVLVEQVEGFLALRAPAMSPERRQAAARFSVVAIEGVLRLEQGLTPAAFAAVIAEAKRAMVQYFVACEAESRVPSDGPFAVRPSLPPGGG